MYRSTDTDTECNALIYNNVLSVLPSVPKGRTEGVKLLVLLKKSALSVFGMASSLREGYVRTEAPLGWGFWYTAFWRR